MRTLLPLTILAAVCVAQKVSTLTSTRGSQKGSPVVQIDNFDDSSHRIGGGAVSARAGTVTRPVANHCVFAVPIRKKLR